MVIIPLFSCNMSKAIDHMRRYRVLFQKDHQTFHALPLSSTFVESKEDLYYKESVLHGDYMYSLGMTAGSIKRHPLKMNEPTLLLPDYPAWINTKFDNETIESIALDGDALLLCITQTTTSQSPQQMVRSVNLINQSQGPVYNIQSNVVLEKIEFMEMEGKKYILAFSSQSSKNIFIASYPPQENSISFSPIASFSNTILCWDQDANEIVAHLADHSTHLVSFAISPESNALEVQRQQTIPAHVFFRFYNPQILLSSKNGDILLWESTMGGSSWIYNRNRSQSWYTLHLSIHNVTQLSSSSTLQSSDPYANASFLSLIHTNGQLEYKLIGTFHIQNDLIEKMQTKEDSSTNN